MHTHSYSSRIKIYFLVVFYYCWSLSAHCAPMKQSVFCRTWAFPPLTQFITSGPILPFTRRLIFHVLILGMSLLTDGEILLQCPIFVGRHSDAAHPQRLSPDVPSSDRFHTVKQASHCSPRYCIESFMTGEAPSVLCCDSELAATLIFATSATTKPRRPHYLSPPPPQPDTPHKLIPSTIAITLEQTRYRWRTIVLLHFTLRSVFCAPSGAPSVAAFHSAGELTASNFPSISPSAL
jgi:hypothetical protein